MPKISVCSNGSNNVLLLIVNIDEVLDTGEEGAVVVVGILGD
jgi:hypothetical protein